jgi:hypothetical protein
MKTETGFELTGKFRMPNDEPPGLEGGQQIVMLFGFDQKLACTVVKVVVEGDDRIVTFATPWVTAIEPGNEQ